MKIYFAPLNPCNTRKVNVKQYIDFISSCGHEILDTPKGADMIFVWGCEFRKDWKDFTHVVIKNLKEKYTSEIVYIGCTFTGEFAKKTEKELGIDVIPWRDTTELIEQKLNEAQKKLKNTKLTLSENKIVDNLEEYRKKNKNARVWFEDEYIKLNICEGCTGYCTYCSEKLMFPKFRSFPEKDIINECKKLIKKDGTKKVLFLADSSGEYGKDIGSSLPNLISRLKDEVDPKIKIGITQLNPEHFLVYRDEMIKFIKEGTIEYMNLPIQVVSDKLLEKMGRQYRFRDIKYLFDMLKENNFTNFSTHLLIGFPGETMSDVEEAAKFLSKYKFRHVIVSAFMNHPAIEASKFKKQVSDKDKRIRVKYCKDYLSKRGIIVHTDLGGISSRLMSTIRGQLGIELKSYEKDND